VNGELFCTLGGGHWTRRRRHRFRPFPRSLPVPADRAALQVAGPPSARPSVGMASGGIDYSKWDHVGESDSDEEGRRAAGPPRVTRLGAGAKVRPGPALTPELSPPPLSPSPMSFRTIGPPLVSLNPNLNLRLTGVLCWGSSTKRQHDRPTGLFYPVMVTENPVLLFTPTQGSGTAPPPAAIPNPPSTTLDAGGRRVPLPSLLTKEGPDGISHRAATWSLRSRPTRVCRPGGGDLDRLAPPYLMPLILVLQTFICHFSSSHRYAVMPPCGYHIRGLLPQDTLVVTESAPPRAFGSSVHPSCPPPRSPSGCRHRGPSGVQQYAPGRGCRLQRRRRPGDPGTRMEELPTPP